MYCVRPDCTLEELRAVARLPSAEVAHDTGNKEEERFKERSFRKRARYKEERYCSEGGEITLKVSR